MKRFLLFDSNCGICSNIASEIERELDGWLQTKSLHDPSIQEYLNSSHPDWEWEPMLMLQRKDQSRQLLTGLSMRLFLAFRLSPSKTMRVVQLVSKLEQRAPLSDDQGYNPRRIFLKTSVPSFLGAIAIFKTQKSFAQGLAGEIFQGGPADKHREDAAERYHGFVLLPEIDSPLPSYVNFPKDHGYHHARFKSFPNKKELRENIPFGLYEVESKYNNLPFLDASYAQDQEHQEILEASVKYGELAYFSEGLENDRLINLIARNKPHYPSPFPIYPVHSVNDETEEFTLVAPEKVKIGNNFGVMLPSQNGYVAHWIAKGVLYTLVVEDSTSKSVMLQILDELSEI